MFTVEASADIAATPGEVFAWVADLDNLPKWQSGVFSIDVISEPPMRIGTRFRETLRVMGRKIVAECEVVEMRPPDLFGFTARGPQMDYRGRLALAAVPGGTRLTQTSYVTMRGFWRLLGPMVRAEASRESRAELQRMKDEIEAIGRPPLRAVAGATR